ncbi:MAG: ADP-ribosylglycohydrolase family protein [Inquilinus sp.]|uniref:ADP-ribosylglycohydrolase family protein n=1 Tax=Inquilinus sp. TaxID=1932117 RepID=UPI003F403292
MIPAGYDDRVYAGWLGKCIGVRFGAPLENWTEAQIRSHIGELEFYLSEDDGRFFKPDDDTAFSMILARIFEDCGASPDITTHQIAEGWLNYLGDQHGTLWWGGYGVAAMHTAYVNLAAGIPAPLAGSAALNGRIVAEEIGGQIFADIWGLMAPGRPDLAADLSERAARVAWDGNALQGARFVAAMVSAAFGIREPAALIAAGLARIDRDGDYAAVVRAMIDAHRRCPDDWRAAFAVLSAEFGYDRYPGTVPIVPNAGVIVLALLYGAGDFSRALRIAAMAGWDTDCNVGNVGAVMGVAVGVGGIDPSWRRPVNDILVNAGLIGCRNLMTIPQGADLLARLGRRLAGVEAGRAPPRRHLRHDGVMGGFQARATGGLGRPIEWRRSTDIDPAGALAVSIRKLGSTGEIRLSTRSHIRPSELSGNFYGASFSPQIHPGQRVTARLWFPPDAPSSLRAGLYVRDDNHDRSHQAETTPLRPGEWQDLAFDIPPLADACLSEVGIVLRNLGGTWEAGSLHLAWLDWGGAPRFSTSFVRERPQTGGISQWTWLRGFWRLEDGAYHASGPARSESYTGDVEWRDYRVAATLVPLVGPAHAVLARVQGARRSYALALTDDGCVTLFRTEGETRAVKSVPFAWVHGRGYRLSVAASGAALRCEVSGADGSAGFEWTDQRPIRHGQIGLANWGGAHTRFTAIEVG